MIFPRVRAIAQGTVFPPNYTVKGISRDGSALVYRIPNNRGGKPYQKNIPAPEWEVAYQRLVESGEFTRTWFKRNIPCAKNGSCNFTLIGEVFVLLELADRQPAKYILRPHASTD